MSTVFNTQSFTISRVSGKTIDPTTGYITSGTTVTINATGNVQPAGKKDLERLPEGLQSKETILIITTTPILINDNVNYSGFDYLAVVIENFTGHLSAGQYEAICTKKDNQGL